MRITRRLAVAAGLAAALALTGCAGGGESAPSASPSETASTSKAAALLPDEIRERGYIVTATDPQWGAPTNYHPGGDTSTWMGLETDLLLAMEPVLGVEFRREDAAHSSIITGITTGRYDFGVSAFIDTVERHGVVDMINYAANTGMTFVVKAGNPAGIEDEADICGRVLAMVSGSTDEKRWRDYSAAECAADQQAEILTFPDRPACLLAVDSGRADIAAGGGAFAINLEHDFDGVHAANKGKFEVLLDKINYGAQTQPLGFMVSKENVELRDAIMAALQEIMDDGEYEKIMKKWYYLPEWYYTSPELNTATE